MTTVRSLRNGQDRLLTGLVVLLAALAVGTFVGLTLTRIVPPDTLQVHVTAIALTLFGLVSGVVTYLALVFGPVRRPFGSALLVALAIFLAGLGACGALEAGMALSFAKRIRRQLPTLSPAAASLCQFRSDQSTQLAEHNLGDRELTYLKRFDGREYAKIDGWGWGDWYRYSCASRTWEHCAEDLCSTLETESAPPPLPHP